MSLQVYQMQQWLALGRGYWVGAFMLMLFIVVGLLTTLVVHYNKRTQARAFYESAIDIDDLLADEKGLTKDYVHFAYLGHNAVTQSSANDPENTSSHAIYRLEQHLKAAESSQAKEAQVSSHDDIVQREDPFDLGKWQEFTYTDSTAKQISFDTVQTLQSNQDLHHWRRKTRYIRGV